MALPIGISFYTFQALSYVVDVHLGRAQPARRPMDSILYLSFFPRVVAGPIERWTGLGSQLQTLHTPRLQDVYVGVKTALWGYFCKLVISDRIAAVVAEVIQHHERASRLSIWLALFLFSFQIYFDFYGYTNIAIGVARTFGVRLTPNFRDPYFARSIPDFWRRWHITLMTWFRDYVYVPLGGNKQGALRRYATIMLVFVLSGLWHGAAITFVLWGLFHAVLYVGSVTSKGLRERISNALRLHRVPRAHAAFQMFTCFACVSIAWLPFITPDLEGVGAILNRALPLSALVVGQALEPVFGRPDSWLFLGILVLFFALDSAGLVRRVLERVPARSREIALELGLVNVMVVSVFLFGDLGSRTFIYLGF